MKSNRFLLLSAFCIISISLFSQEIEKWKDALASEIEIETIKQVEKGCVKNSDSRKNFYLNELEYFPIEKAFDKITELSKDLNKKKTIIFQLYYPIVGFDPEIGYNTSIYVKKRRRIIEVQAYDEESKQFKRSTENHKYIFKMLKRKSDCYGTGYSFITVFDKNMDIIDVKVIASMELK